MGFLRRLAFFLAPLLLSCSHDSDDDVPTRPFAMGFTPFPFDVTPEAVTYTYGRIAAEGDLIAHHFDDGVPWPEALAGDPYHANVQAEWQYRRDNIPPGHKVYLSVTPLNLARDGLAPYKGSSGGMPLPTPWDGYAFNHADVKAAFLGYCRSAIDYFEPDWFCMGIEVNLLMQNAPAKWAAYLELHQYVFAALKADYPDLPLMVSLTGMDLVEGWTGADHASQVQAMNDVDAYSDCFGLSLHCFISAFLAESLPDDLFEAIFGLTSKPVFVCETTYPAEVFTLNGGTLVFNGSPARQDDYLRRLFAACRSRGVKGIVYFVVRDYDALWEAIGSPDDFNKLWRDTGLYDADGAARPALARWRAQAALPRR